MTRKKIFKWIALAVAGLIVVCVVAGFFVLRSRAFHQFVLAEIVSQAEEATGARVQIGDFAFQLRALRADLYRVAIHGTEANPAPPLLWVDHLDVELKIISLLRREIGLRKVEIDHPVVHLTVSAEGQTNLPQPPPSKQSGQSTNLFSLAIDRFRLDRGQIDVNDRQMPLEARLRNLQVQSDFDARKKEYDGALEYGPGEIQVGAYRPVAHRLNLSFSINPEEMRANQLLIRTPESSISGEATLRDYSHPMVNGAYSVALATSEAARLVRSTVMPAGEIKTSGTFSYTSTPNRPLLDSISLGGSIGSPRLSVRLPQARGEVLALSGQYRLQGGNLTVKGLTADVFGGRLAADASILDLAGLPRGRLTATLRSLSLGALRAALPHDQWAAFPIDGSLSARTQASWRGALKGLRVSSDAALNGALMVRGARQTAQQVPLHGTVNAFYDARADALRLRQAVLHTPQSEIDVNGTLGTHTALTIRARSRDLRETDQLVTEVRQFAASPSTHVQPLGVSGSAAFQAVVHGTLQRPRLTGEFSADNLRVEQAAFPHVQAQIAASDSGLAISRGKIQAAQGDVSFRASAGLRNWAYSPSQPVSFELTAGRISIAALASVAHLNCPIKGILSAQVSIRGTVSHPAGLAVVQVVNAEAWHQPIQKLTIRAHGNGTEVQCTLEAGTPGGNIHARVAYLPEGERYQAQLTAPRLDLGRIRLLEAQHVSGIATASVRGQGTLNAPGLQAALSIPDLRIGKESITGTTAQMTVANRVATLALDSNFSGIPAHAHGTLNLSGDYEAAFDLSTGTFEAGPLLSNYVAGSGGNIQCETQLKAWLRGPLKDPQRLQAHLEIPTLRLGYQSVHAFSVSAITADYQNGSVVLKPAEIKGTGTDFHFQATAPVTSNGAIRASATGTIDFHLIQIFEPDWASSGQLHINVAAQGTRSRPEIQGQAHIVNAALMAPDAPIGIQNMNGTIAFTSTRAEITQLSAQAGGGSVVASGSVSYEHGTQFDLAVNADNLHLAYPEGVSEVLATQLRLLGTSNAALLSGQVLINRLSLAPQFDLATFTDQFNTVSTPAGPTTGLINNIKLNVAVRSSQELTVTSDQLSLSGEADLRVVGTIDEPVVVGRVTLASGGSLIFGGNRYRVEAGTIDFVNPVMTEPVLDVSLATTIDQYDVTLTFTGPADSMHTTYTSSPPLAAADIISLLVSGHPTEAPSTGLGAESILAQGLGQASSRVLKTAGLSSLTIDPQVGGYQSNPGVNIGMQKQVTKNLFFTFSVNTATTQDAVVQVQYQVRPRWSVEALRDEVGGYSLEIRSHRSF